MMKHYLYCCKQYKKIQLKDAKFQKYGSKKDELDRSETKGLRLFSNLHSYCCTRKATVDFHNGLEKLIFH